MSQIKIERARGLAATGRYPATFAAMLGHMAPEMIAAVSSRTLAGIIDQLAAASTAAKAVAACDAIMDGGVWDAGAGRFRALDA